MTLEAEVTQELSRAAGLRVQPDWAPAIRAVVERYASRGATSQALDAEARTWLLSEVARHVTVPESYFFRHLAQLAFCAEHAAMRQQTSGQRARIWCAGSATGEEPYSLAILLQRRLGPNLGTSIELFASDLNPEAVEKARSAVYTAWSFRGAPSWCFHFFAAEPGARLRLAQPEVRQLVTFRVESCQVGALNQPTCSLDVVMFRNVAIYLEEAAIQALYRDFARLLRPGGVLALGPSDPRPLGDAFELLGHYDHAPIFVRTLEQATPEAPLLPRSVVAPAASRVELKRGLLERPVAVETPRDRDLEVVQALANAAPLDTTAQRLLGLAHLERNEAGLAVAALRQAVFLDRSDVLSRYFYALALHEDRETLKATRQLENVIQELAQRPAEEKLPDGSTTVGELLRSAMFLGTQWK